MLESGTEEALVYSESELRGLEAVFLPDAKIKITVEGA